MVAGLAQRAWATLWPFDPQTTAPDIASIFGDWDHDRIHDGIDFQKAVGTPVKSIEAGYVIALQRDPTGGSDGIVVIAATSPDAQEGWSYGHVAFSNDQFQALFNAKEMGTLIPAGTILGGVAQFATSFNHLHLERAGRDLLSTPKNPFRFFAPSELPAMEPLLSASDVFFVPDKTAEKLSFPNEISGAPTKISGDVDILAEGHNKVGANSGPGVYTASYFVKNQAGAVVIPERTQVAFNEFPLEAEFDPARQYQGQVYPNGKFGIVFGLGSGPEDFQGRYRITNSGIQAPSPTNGTSNAIENAWFTKARAGVNDDGSTALTLADMAAGPPESKYPDGSYTVGVRVGAYTGATKLVERKVAVANFTPAKPKVTAKDSKGVLRTLFEMVWDAFEKKYKKVIPRDPIVLGPDIYTIEIQFSEPVQNPTLSIDTLGPLALSSSEPEEQQQNFSATLVIDANSTIQDGQRTMTITAQDLSGVDLLALGPTDTEIDPATQLARAADGSPGGTRGPDTSVRFTTSFPLFSVEDRPAAA